jgi:hypothetical protein
MFKGSQESGVRSQEAGVGSQGAPKNPDEYEDDLEDSYDFRNDCEERALSDRTEISLGSNLSTSRRLAIVLVLVPDFFSGVVIRSRAHGAKHLQPWLLAPWLLERAATKNQLGRNNFKHSLTGYPCFVCDWA